MKPNGRGCDTAAVTVDLLAKVVVAAWLARLLAAAGTVVSRISVAESSTSFIEPVVESMVSIL